MDNSLLIAVISGLGGMLGWGVADFFAKKTIDEIGDLKTLFWAQLIGVAPLWFLFWTNPHVPHLQQFDPLFILLFGVVSALSYLPLYAGFGKGEVSLLSPLFAAYSVVVVILAALLFGETISGLQALAIAIVFVGIMLLSTDPRTLRLSLKQKSLRTRGVREVLAAMIMYSFWLVYFDNFIGGKSYVFYLLVIRAIAALTLFVYSLITKQSLAVYNKKLWKFLALIGLFDVFAFASISYGFSHTSYVGIVTVLSATFSLPTIVLAYIFLKERVTRLQALAAAFILAGVVMVSVL